MLHKLEPARGAELLGRRASGIAKKSPIRAVIFENAYDKSV